MSVEVIHDLCTCHGLNQGKVVIQGNSIEEVIGTTAKTAALLGARERLGMFRAGISGQSGPYPVDESGADCTLNVQPGMKYRNEFTVSAGLGT